jgi:rhodanese-related sulfurtransferase
MRIRHPFVQAAVLIAASMAVAVVANAFRGPTRQLKLPGWYPNATTAPRRAAQPVAVASATATTEQSPAPGNPPIVIPTATITTTAPSSTAQPLNTSTAPTTTQPSNPATPQPHPPTTRQPDNPTTPAVDLSKFTPHPDKPYIEISGDDAVALHKSGALFLDARRTEIFQEGHIPGARSYSVWEADVDDKVNALYEERSDPAEQNKPIVIYCSGGACEDSHMLSQKLWGLQFNNVYVYKDGFPDWQKRGLPVRTGAIPR